MSQSSKRAKLKRIFILPVHRLTSFFFKASKMSILESNIVGVQFGILDPETIRQSSAVEVTHDKTYQANNVPHPGGIFDPRFGVIEPGKECPIPSCRQGADKCPGHFGHIVLARPVFLIQFFDLMTIPILKRICLSCSRLLGEKKRVCAHCNAVAPTGITKNKELNVPNVFATYGAKGEERQERLHPERVQALFQRIPDDEIRELGMDPVYSHPAWMITNILRVPPLSVRPSVVENGRRMEDDLSHMLTDIIRGNAQLRESLTSKPVEVVQQYYDKLQVHVAQFVNNNLPNLPKSSERSGRPRKSLKERLVSKGGHMRNNLMGKRVDYSARSVITPDPNIRLDQVGVPQEFATNLTKPEMVNAMNRERLQALVDNGPDAYPGAKKVHQAATGKLLSLRYAKTPVLLRDGDVVHRMLVDGDFVLFNRQPSLHRPSIMAHRVVVLPGHSFRLNPNACKPYNADFDGDEMNMHVPQNVNADVELRELMHLPHHMISPRTSEPIMGPIQDSLTGIYRMTAPGVSLPRHQVLNLLARIANPGFRLSDVPHKASFTGHEILSFVLPKLSFRGARGLTIEDGTLTKGQFVGSAIGGRGALLHTVYNDLGSKTAVDMLTDMQTIVAKFLMTTGFSMGVKDLLLDEETKATDAARLQELMVKADELVRSVHTGEFVNRSGRSNLEELETRIKALTGALESAADKSIEQIPKGSNRMLDMVDSGSKAKSYNVRQAAKGLYQQNAQSKRMPNQIPGRSLPHFSKYDMGLAPHGFVSNSYLTGLSASEFFFHSVGGREGLIDTAVKSVTGDTELLIQDAKGDVKTVQIGPWIDSLLAAAAPERIKHFGPEDANMELLELASPIMIPTIDNKGNASWQALTAVTRHDPGDTVYKITTLTGRTVTVTKANTLLVWDEAKGEFVVRPTEDVDVGDRLPTMTGRNIGQMAITRTYHDIWKYLHPHNDVILDTISIIKPLRSTGIAKMYDVTVPSTLNFMLANGLCVHDTSETGYVQRRLVKSMEDITVNYDETVRNSNGGIVQFRFSEDGMDPMNVVEQPLPLASMSNEEIYRMFALSAADLELLLTDAALAEQSGTVNDLTRQIIADRDLLVRKVFRYRQETSVDMPFAMDKLLQPYLADAGVKTDLTPGIVVAALSQLEKDIPYHPLLHIVLRFWLAPKRSLGDWRLTRDTFAAVLGEVRYKVAWASVHPGSALGVVAAQCIGEPTTQMSVTYDTEIEWAGRIVRIGELIDAKIEEGKMPTQYFSDTDTHIVDVSNLGVTISTVDEDGMTSYQPVTALVRHPPNGKLVRVTLHSGRSVTGTLAKSFLVRGDEDTVVPMNGSELEIGMFMPAEKPTITPEIIDEIDLRELLGNLPDGLVFTDTLDDMVNPDEKSQNIIRRLTNSGWIDRDVLMFAGGNGRGIHLPRVHALTSKLGFLLGAYLADGHCVPENGAISISKACPVFRAHIEEIFADYGLPVCTKVKNSEFGKTTSVCANSKILGFVLRTLCGHLSANKFVPDWAVDAPVAFRTGLLSGYFSGDGWVADNGTPHVSAHSKSRKLVDGIQELLASLGIHCIVHLEGQIWRLDMFGRYAVAFADTIDLVNAEKGARLQAIQGRTDVSDWVETTDDLLWDRIVNLEVIDCAEPYVYDMTVPSTLNFGLANGIFVRDTLNTFHVSGTSMASGTQGVPRIKELIGPSNNPSKPNTYIYLEPEIRHDHEAAFRLKQDLQLTTIDDILLQCRVYASPTGKHAVLPEDEAWVDDYIKFMRALGRKEPTTSAPLVIRLVFNDAEMEARGLTMEEVETRLRGLDKVTDVLSTDSNADKLVALIRVDASAVADRRQIVEELKATVVHGLAGMTRVFLEENKVEMVFDTRAGAWQAKPHYYLVTEGYNLPGVLGVPGVDATRTISNYILEVYSVYGIEAARQLLLRELQAVFAGAGLKVNPRHFSLLADRMCRTGVILPVSHNGMDKDGDIGPLSKASFEQTDKVLAKAAINGTLDPVSGISSNIILGQRAPCGTGIVNLLIDEQRLPEARAAARPVPVTAALNSVEPLDDDDLELDMGWE